jgi:hypothetical protein
MMNFWNGDIAFVVHKYEKCEFKKQIHNNVKIETRKIKLHQMRNKKIKCNEIFSMQESSI